MAIITRWIGLTLAIVVCYFLLGSLGLALALPPGFVSAIWPAAGFAFAAAVLWGGKSTWFGILLGSVLTNATVGGGFHINTVAMGIAVGSTLQAVLGGAALRRLMPGLELNDPGKVLRFSLIVVVSCLVAATIGNLTLLVHGFIAPSQIPQSFVTWWFGDAFGVQIFAPLSLMLLAPHASWRQRRLSVGLPLLVAFTLSGVVYYVVRVAEERQLLRDFAAATDHFNHEINGLERNISQGLVNLAEGYTLRGQMPGEEFDQLAAGVYRSVPGLWSIAWAPVLNSVTPDPRRPANSAPAAVRWPQGFHPSADGLMAPVAAVYPLEGHEMAIGVDLLGEPRRAAALRQALVTGLLSVSAPFQMLSDAKGPGAVLWMVPITHGAQRGVLVGTLDLRTIDRALAGLPGAAWELREVDAGGEHTVWSSSALNMPVFATPTFWDRAGVYGQQTLQIGGRQWHLLIHMPHSRLVANAGNSSLLVLMLTFFACGVLVNFALIRTGERERTLAVVLEKTAALNAEIAERKIYEEALVQAKMDADSANLAKSQFLATMSHEIRTPMNGILGMAQLLMMDDVSNAKRKEFVQIILGSGKTLLAILNDILDLSKIEAGKMELMECVFDASLLVQEVATLFREAAHGKGIVVTVHAAPGVGRYLGDPIRLRQMLTNYVGNAIKFSQNGTVTLEVREVADAKGAMLLEFAVADQGIGIDEEHLAHLFQPFVQVDASATRRFGGTGLGLSIVRRLAEQMQGGVGATSRMGQGSRFWFTACCARVAPVADARQIRREAQPPAAAPPTLQATEAAKPHAWVMVVDDNAINQMVAENMLMRLGVQVRRAQNGQEALDLLDLHRQEPPMLVLMDCQMPVMDGFAATRAIREQEQATGAPRLRIIAVTASAYEDDRDLCLAAGMDDFISKPFAYDDLARIVKDFAM